LNDSTIPPLKRCSTCGKEYPAMHEWFYVNRRSKDGLTAQCILCGRKRSKARYRAAHPEVKQGFPIRGLNKAIYNRVYYEENREKLKAQTRQYRINNAEHIRINRPRWKSSQNSEAKRKYNRQWREKNLDRYRASARRVQHRRRARIKNQPSIFTAEDEYRMMHYWNHSCAVCGRTADLFTDIVADHWIAIEKSGGSTSANLVPLCHTKPGGATGLVSCNQSKGDKDPAEWLEQCFGKRRTHAIRLRVADYFEWLHKQAD
jgi:hypothetical protein